MLQASQFIGHKVYVYEEENQPAIAETTITEVELTKMIIKMNSPTLYQRKGGRVTVLLLLENAIYEFRGMLRRSNYGLVEIALYQGKEREKRVSKRFAVLTEAFVDTLLSGNKKIPLKKPLVMQVVNISTSGAMLQGEPRALQDGACFQLRMNIGQGETAIDSTVVWTKEVSPLLWEYGCNFTALSNQ